jgi:ABC-type transport system involved in Fe-S cluster assembly fused permease/ATPase subunit
VTKIPPQRLGTIKNYLFIADRLMNFTKILLSDLDFDILWLMVCFYIALDAAGLHIMHSTVIFYIYYRIFIVKLRTFFGEWKLAQTSGIDERFLL